MAGDIGLNQSIATGMECGPKLELVQSTDRICQKPEAKL